MTTETDLMRNPFKRRNQTSEEAPEVEEVDIFYDEEDQPVVAVDLDAVDATLNEWIASMAEEYEKGLRSGEYERAQQLELNDDQHRALVVEAFNDRSNWLRHGEDPTGDRVGIFRVDLATGRIEASSRFWEGE